MTTNIEERIASLEERLQQLKARQARTEARKRTLPFRRTRKDTPTAELEGKRFHLWLDQTHTRTNDRALFGLPARDHTARPPLRAAGSIRHPRPPPLLAGFVRPRGSGGLWLRLLSGIRLGGGAPRLVGRPA